MDTIVSCMGRLGIRKRVFLSSLTDDIIIDILIRLPADCLFQCRHVCRSWRALTSTPSFVKMHLNRATPLIVTQPTVHNRDFEITLCFFDQGHKNMVQRSMKIKLSNFPDTSYAFSLIGSYDGLLLFREDFHFKGRGWYIWNPITQEQVAITRPVNSFPYGECGFFFYPPTRDYRLLYFHSEGGCFGFKILSLRTESLRQITNFSHPPRPKTIPTISNGAMHWMVSDVLYKKEYGILPRCSESILSFKIETEDFHLIPHPGGECLSGTRKHDKMHLLAVEGHLCFCDGSSDVLLQIWVLEDYANRVWVKRHRVFLYLVDADLYPFDRIIPNARVKPLYVNNGELLLRWPGRGLYFYHLQHKTFRLVFEDCATCVHTHGLVSLHTTNSRIFLNRIPHIKT